MGCISVDFGDHSLSCFPFSAWIGTHGQTDNLTDATDATHSTAPVVTGNKYTVR